MQWGMNLRDVCPTDTLPQYDKAILCLGISMWMLLWEILMIDIYRDSGIIVLSRWSIQNICVWEIFVIDSLLYTLHIYNGTGNKGLKHKSRELPNRYEFNEFPWISYRYTPALAIFRTDIKAVPSLGIQTDYISKHQATNLWVILSDQVIANTGNSWMVWV